MYQKYYHNRRMNAVVQDAFLGRGTKSPYLAILNHIGLVCDENAPRSVSDEFIAAVGPSQAMMDLEEELADLIEAGDDEGITRVRKQLRAARQKHRRETVAVVRTTTSRSGTRRSWIGRCEAFTCRRRPSSRSRSPCPSGGALRLSSAI